MKKGALSTLAWHARDTYFDVSRTPWRLTLVFARHLWTATVTCARHHRFRMNQRPSKRSLATNRYRVVLRRVSAREFFMHKLYDHRSFRLSRILFIRTQHLTVMILYLLIRLPTSRHRLIRLINLQSSNSNSEIFKIFYTTCER